MVIQSLAMRPDRGFLTTELVVAMAILATASLPLGYSILHERQLLRASYHRAVAEQIVDGEMEILVAGEWRMIPEGIQDYHVRAAAATNLPPGRFRFTRHEKQLRLEWLPARHPNGAIQREVKLP